MRQALPRLSIAAVVAAGVLAAPAATSADDARPDRAETGTLAQQSRPAYAEQSGFLREPGAAQAQAQAAQAPAARAKRPNILVMTTDDMAIGDLRFMPRTRRLLQRQGTTFSDAVAPTPVCVPARASMLTGQYTHNHGALTISGAHGGFKAYDDDNTLPEWLQDAGYDTALIGKYLNGYDTRAPNYVPPGWTNWNVANGRVYSYRAVRYNLNGRTFSPLKAYSTDTIAGLTNNWLKRKARKRDPWFAWVTFVGPHQGGRVERDDPKAKWPRLKRVHLQNTTPAPRHRNKFTKLRLPGHPEMWKNSRKSAFPGPQRGRIYKRAMREVFQQRIEALQSVDQAVGRTMRTLRRTGQLRNTYVVFTSDNGFLTGDHNREGKLVGWNRAVRIPMLMRGPGVPKRRTVRTTVTNPDLGVTVADIAGATPGRNVDGRSMLPFLRGGKVNRVIPLEAYPIRGGNKRIYQGIRYGSWTYIKARGREDLYNRANDPGELRDLAGKPKYRAQLKKMRRWSRLYRDCAGSSCRARVR